MTSAEGEDSSLDLLSVAFDPVRALQCSPSKVALPHPTVQPCDNLEAYSSVVRGTKQTPRQRTPPQEADSALPKKTTVAKKKVVKTVFDFMEKGDAGPFSLLQQCRSLKHRVTVTLRHCAVLGQVIEWYTPFRTTANGGITESKNRRRKMKIKAESAGVDTTADYTVATPEPAGSTLEFPDPPKGIGPLGGHKWESRRTVAQLFIRGDNIIHVSRTPDHPPAAL